MLRKTNIISCVRPKERPLSKKRRTTTGGSGMAFATDDEDSLTELMHKVALETALVQRNIVIALEGGGYTVKDTIILGVCALVQHVCKQRVRGHMCVLYDLDSTTEYVLMGNLARILQLTARMKIVAVNQLAVLLPPPSSAVSPLE